MDDSNTSSAGVYTDDQIETLENHVIMYGEEAAWLLTKTDPEIRQWIERRISNVLDPQPEVATESSDYPDLPAELLVVRSPDWGSQ